ncbi:phage tail assembly chaperone [Octadecabacter sp. 1_MG-2023]|uniref:rcc01693 family protein n=1 Tax=unclassified Octadecabacter TaxID=196158 RepID=UPI001C08C1AF|nr:MULTISPECIES: rcc01693 family protein [unclassified Octadecabacter]MBU2993700.1 phage tail assembly chaperone [Octadecabacter sp. B2R22]MDO6735456.1 phage tail assembly chaperone [Octadecabacter sp. 1_MG-2023]
MKGSDGGFDWPAMMRVALKGLELKPDEFWALTPAEFWLLLGDEVGAMPMGRSRLDELSRSYPDRVSGKGEDDG